MFIIIISYFFLNIREAAKKNSSTSDQAIKERIFSPAILGLKVPISSIIIDWGEEKKVSNNVLFP